MKSTSREPERWSERPARGTSAEDAVGAAFRRVRQATEPTEAALGRIVLPADEPPPEARPLLWRVVAVCSLVMATGGVVGAANGVFHLGGLLTSRGASPAKPAVAVAEHAHAHWPRAARTSGELRAPAEAPAGTGPALAGEETAAASATAPAGEAAPATQAARPARAWSPPAHATSASEARALAQVFRELRAEGDAAAALSSLDRFDRRFANGALRAEAVIARAEALNRLGRRAETLPLLLRIEELGGHPTRAVRIARGELLVEAGRCGEALRDFNALLAAGESDELAGNALYGRATCYLRAGELAAARPDLERYLAIYPNGPFAPTARRALAATP